MNLYVETIFFMFIVAIISIIMKLPFNPYFFIWLGTTYLLFIIAAYINYKNYKNSEND